MEDTLRVAQHKPLGRQNAVLAVERIPMPNLPGLPIAEQTLLQNVSDAVSERIVASMQTLRAEDSAGLRDLFDDAILQGITQALSKVDQRHATAVLGAERSSRADARAG